MIRGSKAPATGGPSLRDEENASNGRTVLPILLRQHRRRLRIFLLLLRARLPVFLRDLPGLFLALPHERFQILPAIADDQPQPVAPLEMLAQPGKQPGLHRLHLRLFDREARFQFRQPRPRRVHQRPQPLQLRVHVKHQAPARDGHGSRVPRALPGDEPRGFRRFLQAPQIPAPHPRIARVGGLRQTAQPAAQPGVGARLRDGPALA